MADQLPGAFAALQPPPASDISSSSSGPILDRTFLNGPGTALEPGEIPATGQAMDTSRQSEDEIFESDYSDEVRSCSPSAPDVSIPCITLSSDSSINTTQGDVSHLDPATVDPAVIVSNYNDPRPEDPCILAVAHTDPRLYDSGSSMEANTGSPWPTPPSVAEVLAASHPASAATVPIAAPLSSNGSGTTATTEDSAYVSLPCSGATSRAEDSDESSLTLPANYRYAPGRTDLASIGVDSHGNAFTVDPPLPGYDEHGFNGFNSSDDQTLADAYQVAMDDLAASQSLPPAETSQEDASSQEDEATVVSQILADIAIIQTSPDAASPNESPDKTNAEEDGPPGRKAGN